MKKKIIVKGPILTRSGYGEQCRFALRALRQHEDEYDIHAIAIPWGNTGWIYETSEEREWIDGIINKTVTKLSKGETFDMSLQITIPNEWEKMAPINIGYTAGIETTKTAPVWLEKANMMDKIIVVSNHSKNVYETSIYQTQHKQTGELGVLKCETPIDVVGYPVRLFEPADIDLNLEYDFNFLAFAQWGPRKNLENTIRWFVEEFYDDEVGLIVKANLAKNCLMDRKASFHKLKELLKKYKNRKCKIYLLHGTMNENEISALYNHDKIKGFISLTHGEGYGLPIFEAAYYGLPVIAPAWSGHCDFLFAPVKNKKTKKTKIKPLFGKVDYVLQPIQEEAIWEGVLQKDSMWCFPQERSYKTRLREMYKTYARFFGQARTLKKHIHKNFDEKVLYTKFVESLKVSDNNESSLVMVV